MTSNRARSRVKVNKTANIRCHKYKNDIMKNLIDNRFIDCEDIPENTAIYNLNTKVLRQGKTKLSYKQIHKTRGVRCRVPEYKVDFKPLSDNLEKWIETYKEDKND